MAVSAKVLAEKISSFLGSIPAKSILGISGLWLNKDEIKSDPEGPCFSFLEASVQKSHLFYLFDVIFS